MKFIKANGCIKKSELQTLVEEAEEMYRDYVNGGSKMTDLDIKLYEAM